ncbi:D-Ala-D-Ala carboxypeptidase family metallohydrolase [Gammaproteobacteria bacterium]|nr:D-Ala-D-Ala carboxypeptidase family metallohydrolase [Gammaproteobacteria bacterium]
MSKYFSDKELACKCGECSGENQMSPAFMERLDELRSEYGKPIILSSAYRCPAHNKKVSSTGENGPHTTGKAVDIKVSGQDAHRVTRIAFRLGFTGIGIKQSGRWQSRFIHVDTLSMGDTRPRVWSY